MADKPSNMPVPSKAIRVLATAAVVVVGVVLAWILYARYVDRPWTRDGQVRADIINITSYVSGKVVKVHVRGEELVDVGQLLFEVDPSSYQLAVAQAEVALDAAREEVESLKATLRVPGEGNVRIRAAKVALDTAKLNLERTRIVAPRKGWVSNLFLQPGSYVQPGQAMITLVDKESLRVSAFFKETQIFHIKPGDRAVVTLMGLSDRPLEGIVENIGRAINPPQIAMIQSSSAIVPSISPTYDWIRLAQRVPVQIRLERIPDDILLVSGATVSVFIQPSK